MRRVLILLSLLFFGFQSLEGQDVSAKNEQKQRIEEEISYIDAQLKGLSVKQKSTTEHLVLVQKKASDRKSVIRSLEKEISSLDTEIASRTQEINRLTAERDTLKAYFERLVYNSYKHRDTRVWFLYILGSESVGQGYRRLSYLKNLSRQVNRQGEEINELQRRIEAEKEALAKRRAEAGELRKVREKEYSRLVADEKESRSIIKNLEKDRKRYQKDLARKRKEVAALNKEIERILKAAVKKEKKTALSAAEVALSGEFEQNRGHLGWPVAKGVITEGFGVHYHPVWKNIKLPDSNGVTISTTAGAQVFCVFSGIVKQIIIMPGYSYCVLVQHGSYYTFYCKLGKVSVKSGQKVNAGDVLGTLESEGASSSIHFQIWKGTVRQDPETWLR